MNLDGETNLKDRELAIGNLKEENIIKFNGKIIADSPNPNLD
jgi:hypothetical protein